MRVRDTAPKKQTYKQANQQKQNNSVQGPDWLRSVKVLNGYIKAFSAKNEMYASVTHFQFSSVYVLE